MNRKLIILATIILVCLPGCRNKEDSLFERDQYKMDLTLDVENKQISGKISIVINNDSNDIWDKLCFRDYVIPVYSLYDYDIQEDLELDVQDDFINELNSEIITVIEVETGEVLKIESLDDDKSIIYVYLEKPLQPNEKTEIEMTYIADIPPGGYRYAYHLFDDNKLSFELGNFYPILSIYEDGDWVTHPYIDHGECFYSKCSDYYVTFKAPDEYIVIASGKEKLLKTDSGISTWQIEAENMRDFTVTISNNLGKISQQYENTTVNSYYFLEENKIGHEILGKSTLYAGVESIKMFTELFGNYPYDELDIVEAYFYDSGMEYPSLIRISSNLVGFMKDANGNYIINQEYVNDNELQGLFEQRYSIIESVVAHEVAHQWFYAVVGNDSYNDSWLDESFASFAELLYNKNNMTEENFVKMIDLEPKYINLPLHDYDDSNYTIVYIKGRSFIYQILDIMGETSFFNMMQDYYKEFMFKEVKTKDFIYFVHKYAPNNDEINELINSYIKLEL